MDNKKRYFTSIDSDPKWEKNINVNRILPESKVHVNEYENGYILPLRIKEGNTMSQVKFEGGVCDSNLNFVAGIKRDYNNPDANIACNAAYEPDKKNIEHSDEVVVFGGVLNSHFGNMLTNTTTRLWWFAENKDTKLKIAFVRRAREKTHNQEFLDLLGITADRMIIVEKPTQFKKVIVPDEACYIMTCASYKWVEAFDLIKENVSKKMDPSPYKKIYLSRTAFKRFGSYDGVNEEFYEKFYERRGFKILHPEKYPLAEQVNYLMNADEIVSTFGTLTHLLLFAKSGVKSTAILRVPELWVHQLVINAVREVDWYWFEGTKNPMPTKHDHGIFLYWPTESFKKCLECQGVEYKPEELPGSDVPSAEYVAEYMKLWTYRFSQKEFLNEIKNKSIYDVVRAQRMFWFNQDLNSPTGSGTPAANSKPQQKKTPAAGQTVSVPAKAPVASYAEEPFKKIARRVLAKFRKQDFAGHIEYRIEDMPSYDGDTAGVTGKSKPIYGLSAKLCGSAASGKVLCSIRPQDSGFTGFSASKRKTASNVPITGIAVKLSGKVADKYSVKYRVHQSRVGWQEWAKDGQETGDPEYNIEAVEIVLEPKDN